MAEPISIQQLKNASLDVKSLEEVVNGDENVVVTTRLGETYPSVKSVINNLVTQSGLIIVDSFEIGATITQRNQVLRDDTTNRLYQWAGELPKTVDANSTPESSGGFGTNAWVEVSDISLSQRLFGIGGASTIGNGISVFNNMAEFLESESKIKDGSRVFLASIYQDLDLEGEGRVYTYSKTNSDGFIEISTATGYLKREFDGKVFIAEHGATGEDLVKDSLALQKCFDNIRNSVTGGIISMGTRCNYTITGIIEANCNNLDWRFNGTTLNVGRTWIAWRARALGYRNYHNIRISQAKIFGGNILGDDTAEGSFSLDVCKVDNIVVEDCEFTKATTSGHLLDLQGSRFVYFRRNVVRGFNTRVGREFAEAVQVSRAALGGSGVPAREEEKDFWDFLVTCYVYFYENKFEPYTDLETGEVSYPPRPIGEHSDYIACYDIYVVNNIFDNIISNEDKSAYMERSIISLSGIDNLFVENNNFIMSNSYNKAVITLGTGSSINRPLVAESRFSVINNNIVCDLPEREGDYPYLEGVALYHRSGTSTLYNVTIEGNTFDMKSASPIGEGYGVIIKGNQTGNRANKLNISNNNFKLVGGFTNAINLRDGTGSEVITRNIFNGLLRRQSILGNTKNHPTHPIIKDNIFKSQWRAVYIATSEQAVFMNNVLESYSDTSYSGEVDGTTDILGGSSTVNIVGKDTYGANKKVASSGNVIIGDGRATPVKIRNVTTARPEYEYLIVP